MLIPFRRIQRSCWLTPVIRMNWQKWTCMKGSLASGQAGRISGQKAETEPKLDEEGNPLLDENDNPVMKTEEEIWQEFLLVSTAETDEEGNPVVPLFSVDEISVISDLDQYIYNPADYSYLASYSSYTEETLDEFISRLSPDADFIERSYIKALYKGHGIFYWKQDCPWGTAIGKP